ncbi:hypothetical protein K435DRAFT_817491 [Dendrothele bispora CBS 962.96]|uniref:UBX domain-containing protein n=1 Tax=Dendrothele bispora (strain CBS 962.96) TaxID=1314807 RepID=A0A4S8MJF6_DENBC|nr:hypothetical protein K435DRAFT_817491 [Dendrothele bispora CBS 962.96]
MSEKQPNAGPSLDVPTENNSEGIQEKSIQPQSQPDTQSSAPAFKVWKPSNFVSPPPPPPPDEYFTPTAADLKLAQSQLSARTHALTDAPLQLRATREAAERQKKDRWPYTTIRIRFTDRTQLEKVFPSTDKIKSVYAFVRSSLREDVKPIKFILYEPPRRELKVSDTKVKDLMLADLGLAPSAVLLLRFEDEKLNGTTVPAPLARSVLELAQDLPVPPPPEDFTAPSKTEQPKSNNPLSNLTSGEKKLPKWLKLGST